jgi:Domain of unknown function (DUF4359)
MRGWVALMMAQWQVVPIGLLTICGLGGMMILTNPDRTAYEAYAVERVGELAKDQCDRAPAGLGIVLQGPCRAAIESFKPQLKPLLAASTSRQNFIFFSIYKSDISIPAASLNAKVESIGAFNNFFTYKAP